MTTTITDTAPVSVSLGEAMALTFAVGYGKPKNDLIADTVRALNDPEADSTRIKAAVERLQALQLISVFEGNLALTQRGARALRAFEERVKGFQVQLSIARAPRAF